MHTFSGIEITRKKLCAPEPMDLAVQMGRVCRYGGAHWWTLTPHSLLVLRILSDLQHGYDTELMGFLHDGHEIITGDAPYDFKPDQMESDQDKLDILIAKRYGINMELVNKNAIHWADGAALVAEASVLRGNMDARAWPQAAGIPKEVLLKHASYVKILIDSDWTKAEIVTDPASWTTSVVEASLLIAGNGHLSVAIDGLLRNM